MVRLNRIYTRTGDRGTAGLADGSRVSKSGARMHAIGNVDEANAAIALASALAADEALESKLLRIQNEMFDLGADIATPGDSDGALRVIASQVERLEQEIDEMNTDLEPLRSFILPGGAGGSAELHLARAIVRRAERSAVEAAATLPINPLALKYLNRLSDHLFVLARLVALGSGGDILWQPGSTRGG